MNNNIRSGNVDLVRFIAALIIMTFHLFYMGIGSYPFQDGWIYVEFFLIITGFYTARRFDGKNYDNPIKESIIYTYKKFIIFLPYTIVTTTLMYLLNFLPSFLFGSLSIKGFLFSFTQDYIFDILLISESYSHPLVPPLWYLSALIIVFPLFSWLTQIKNRYWIIIITSFYTLFYYGIVGFIGHRVYLTDLLRVLAGMCLGTFVYEILYSLSYYFNRISKIVLTVVEIFAFLMPVIITYKNAGSHRFVLFCFMICLAIMLSNSSYTNVIKGKLCTYLGKLSMPLFIIHGFMGVFIARLSSKIMLTDTTKIVLYYIVSIALSVIAMYIVDRWKWFQEFIKKPLVLRD